MRAAASAILGLALLASAGCRGTIPPAPDVQTAVAIRSDIPTDDVPWSPDLLLDIPLSDSLAELDCVTLALANNPGYRAMLADLGISQARVYDAGLLSDPQFVMFFPLGPKQLEFTLFQAIDTIWMQPIRVRAAALDLDQLAATMVQQGLNVIRDARVAHAELSFAQRSRELAEQARAIRAEIADLAARRLDAGDISPLEATTSEVALLRAEAAVLEQQQNVELARARLQALLGAESVAVPLQADPAPVPSLPSSSVEELVHEALAVRPDLRAAELQGEAACARAGLARSQFMLLDAVFDANGEGLEGFESGPGLRLTIPIFNGNRGGVAIADSEVVKAWKQYAAVRNQIALEVRTAYAQAVQAASQLAVVQEQMLPKLQRAESLALRAYREGDITYFLVLETTAQDLDVRARELQLTFALHRAMAELERSVGHRIQSDETLENAPERVQPEEVAPEPPSEPALNVLPEPASPQADLTPDRTPDEEAEATALGPKLRAASARKADGRGAVSGVLSSEDADSTISAEPQLPERDPSRVRILRGGAGRLRWRAEDRRHENAACQD